MTHDLHLSDYPSWLSPACALVIGAQYQTSPGIGNGRENGVLVKGGELWTISPKVDTLVF
ncbi:hypothetical protein Len3610_12945 [Lentibacillus sp. CBA3610]|nr:hypothetical protein Len3610_12945 [Lentibacillus sp. CBA3610]